MRQDVTPLVYYDSGQLAELLGVPVSTVHFWRVNGKGPKFSRLGKHVRYSHGDVAAWTEANKYDRT
jgi:DNA-binding transcriptional MerR regulator